MNLAPNQKVNYVASDGDVKPATVAEVVHDAGDNKIARLQVSENHTALAHYDPDRKPNTFHFLEEKGTKRRTEETTQLSTK